MNVEWTTFQIYTKNLTLSRLLIWCRCVDSTHEKILCQKCYRMFRNPNSHWNRIYGWYKRRSRPLIYYEIIKKYVFSHSKWTIKTVSINLYKTNWINSRNKIRFGANWSIQLKFRENNSFCGWYTLNLFFILLFMSSLLFYLY